LQMEPQNAVAGMVALYALKRIWRVFRIIYGNPSASAALLVKAVDKRKQRDTKRCQFKTMLEEKRQELGLTEDKMNNIIPLTATELLEGMKTKKFSCVEVVTTFCSRALEFGEHSNNVTEEFYDEAITSAMLVDDRRAKGIPDRLLEGVPISLKDQIHQKGADSTCGLAVRCFQPSEEHGLLTELLVEQGAIPFVRSNVPQCLLLPESANAIWGVAQHPTRPDRTPGGSSGGEAALVAHHGSPLGIGTDIGGSVRIPAHYCGVYAFKPTPQRNSRKGLAVQRLNDKSGQECIVSAAGPIGNSVDDLVLVMRSWWVDKMYEKSPTTPPLPFCMDQYKSPAPLRVGYFTFDGWCEAAPPCVRAVEEACDKLRSAGVEVVKWNLPDFSDTMVRYFQLMGADGEMRGFFDALSGEALNPMYKTLFQASMLPNSIRPFVSYLLTALGETRLGQLCKAAGSKSVYEYWKIQAEKTAYTNEVFEKIREARLDAIICPGGSLPALPHGLSKDLVLTLSYTILFNVLHMPAGCVPMTTVRAGEEVYEAHITKHKDKLVQLSKQTMKGSEGLPIGVQVATLPFQDEKCLRVMKILETGEM